MKRWMTGVAALAAPVCLLAAEHKDQWQRTVPVTGDSRLEVRNINGDIRVIADSGNTVRMTVREEYSAPTPEELAELRNEVRVTVKQEGNLVRLALENPQRERRSNRQRRDWRFHHDFELQVPRNMEMSLHNVNGRELSVAGATGKWELKSVNGAVTMTDAAGYGSAETLNGPVRVTFASNPSQPSAFKTLNGSIDVSFQPDLSADLAISTMHGEAYTDFDFQQGLPTATTVQREGNRYRISDAKGRLRIGAGGPEHQFKTMNGSIKIRKHGKQG